ncbi:MAG: VOC family protein [Acidimicrobiia bacterium]
MPIREFFHLMQIVDDFDDAEKRYAALLSPYTYAPKHWSDMDKRWASLALVGCEFVLELMEPSTNPADFASPLPKFHQRFGEHLHSLSWYVDAEDMPALFYGLREAGVRIAAATGGIIPPGPVAPEDVPRYIFTHGQDTFGQLEFMSHTSSHPTDPRFGGPAIDWTTWSEQHPMHIERISHITVMADDLDRAKQLYGDVMGGTVLSERETADRRSVFILVGYDIVVEFAAAKTADSRLARDRASSSQLPHAMTFKVRDLADVERHVAAIGLTPIERTDHTVTLDPADFANAEIAFTVAAIENDPRR